MKESGQTTIEPWLEKEAVMDAGGGGFGGDRKPKQDSDVRQGGDGGGRGRGGRSSGRGGSRGRQGGRGGQQNGRGRGRGGRT